jgi:glycosyltransferase involved in cell wall biosynthesis
MKKKVLILITRGEVGGAQTFAINLAKGLTDKGYLVTVGFGQEGGYLKQESVRNKIPTVQFPGLVRGFNIFKIYQFVQNFRKFLNNNNFDVLHLNSSNTIFAAMAARLAHKKPKIVFTVHGLSYLDANAQKNKIIKLAVYFVYKFLFKFIDEIIFVCRANLEYAQKIKLVSKGEIIYNGVNSEFKEKIQTLNFLEEKLGIELTGKKIVGSIGRLAYPKNYDFLIKAASGMQLSNTVFIIIGDGPLRQKYQKMINKLGIQNIFYLAGEITKAETYLLAFNVFVLVSEYEGLPLTLLSALRAEIPVLASNVGGVSEVLPSLSELYQKNNINEFSKKLKLLLASKTKKIRREGFTVSKMVDAYSQLYNL